MTMWTFPDERRERLARASTVLALILLYLACVLVRVDVVRFHREREAWFPFTGESALIFHYARRVALGEGIPARDPMVGPGEGMDVWRTLSIGVELASGKLYRVLPAGVMDFQAFMRLLTAVVFSSGVVAAYLVCRSLWGGRWGPLAGAACYGLSLASVTRSSGIEISKENFALPLIFFHIWLLLGGTLGRRRMAAAAVVLAAALISWEGTQVYFLLLVIWFAVRWLKRGDEDALPGFTIQVGAAVVAAAAVPYLRAHGFGFSYCMVLGLSVVAAAYLERKCRPWGLHRAWYFVPVALGLLVAAVAVGRYHESYSHIESLLFWKVRFLARRPVDPGLLPFGVRILWTPAMTEPSLRQGTMNFAGWLLLAVLPVIGLLRRRPDTVEKERLGSFVLTAAAVFMVLYMGFHRIMVFLVFFLTVLCGGLVSLAGRRRVLAIVAGTVLAAAALAAAYDVRVLRPQLGRPPDAAPYAALQSLVERVRETTPADCVILAPFDLSPVLLAYGGRAIAQHPKFESVKVRDEVEEYAMALFGEDEDEFHAYCERVDASYFVFPKGTFSTVHPYSWGYITATPPGARDRTAWRFERAPLGLRKFGLDYQDVRYKLYKVFRSRDIEEGKRARDRGHDYLERGMLQLAVAEYEAAIQLYPKDVDSHAKLGTAYWTLGYREKAGQEWRKANELLRAAP